MAVGRGSARVAMAALCLLLVVLQCEVTQAATYVVGDDNGWSSNIGGWEEGKTFKADDILVFNYQQGAHNVVVVSEEGYDGCSATPSDKVYTSGNDQITLVKGLNNFICGFPGHCAAGMKLQISAS
ncbi:putative Phytocyanin domain, cupredoxin [Helianthus annuus]|uniref:Basic blue protein n=1 Tax=Helianthus annuus TaxID=4232 RepID=A0A1Y3BXU5_HELAN|nr:basic blue protein [Helianthus annuus]KAF5781698.1 putative Phytocyanin domain, cupredoxin [Helianthus annuus]KAJ0501273.1 putative Phytocyanin domain, cupredoxin [Helianthus annuus]KAJ0501278.1 putative Phytocyanin domain, cupredoxin [Helianthus annuus]KAJ0509021.1 putative Phytocyanin domain, cupredoxin [Helianthus annuus]KAJ0509027.1 putative Phytocyanin domain, cupredoxin [Helianthus annuus]